MTITIPEDRKDAINETIAELKKGNLIAFPTDTVYGLGCDVFNSDAIIKIFQVKGRDFAKALPIMVGEIEQIFRVASYVDERTRILIYRYWPGALTIILPKREELPSQVSQTSTIGIRMPDHKFCLELLRKIGPLAVTSANLSGNPEALTAHDVFAQFDNKVRVIIDGGNSIGRIPSTIIDCSFVPAKIIREGVIKSEEIRKLID